MKPNNREYDSVNSSQNIVLHFSLMMFLLLCQSEDDLMWNQYMINIVANEIIIIREAFPECKTNLTQLCNPKTSQHKNSQIRRLGRSRIAIKNNTYYGFII